MFLAHATDPGHRTLAVFDEIHHAGSDSMWGTSAQESFARYAHAVLSLTGTPFRTDKDPIVFVPSVDGHATPDYAYRYDKAIADGACRPVQFVYARGRTTFRTEDGQVHSVTFDDALSERGERRRLATALEVVEEGSIAHTLLRSANQYLLTLRRLGDTDAGGLIVTVDCDHADRVAAFMAQSVTGLRPVMACSRLVDPTDPEPADAIRDFRTSHDPWMVAVNMVSEGVDIRRLRVVVYLTNRLTKLAFRQIVGRVVRTDRENVDDHGRVYLPADPTLIQLANTITEDAGLLPTPLTIATDAAPQTVTIQRHGHERVPFLTVESVGEEGGASDTSGRYVGHQLVQVARQFIELRDLTGTDPASLALAAAETPGLFAAMQEEIAGAS